MFLVCPSRYVDVLSKLTKLRETFEFPFPIFFIVFFWAPYSGIPGIPTMLTLPISHIYL